MRKSLARCVLSAAAVLLGAVILRRQIKRPSFEGQVVLITGGARGLGLEMARLWGAEGARVAICSRTPMDVQRAVSELRKRGIDVIGQICDVTEPTDVQKFVEAVLERWGRIDVLVNNAGIIQVGPVDCMTHEDYRHAMRTHFWGPLFTMEAVLPQMRRRGAGSIVNIASIGGKLSVPHLIPYCASKFALVGLSEGLRAELAGDGVSVVTVCPGLMRTGSAPNALFKGRHQAEYAWFSISSGLPGLTISSTRAARQIVEACRHGRAQLVVSWPARLAICIHDFCPGVMSFFFKMVNRALPTPSAHGYFSVPGYRSTSRWSPSILTLLADRAARRNNEV